MFSSTVKVALLLATDPHCAWTTNVPLACPVARPVYSIGQDPKLGFEIQVTIGFGIMFVHESYAKTENYWEDPDCIVDVVGVTTSWDMIGAKSSHVLIF